MKKKIAFIYCLDYKRVSDQMSNIFTRLSTTTLNGRWAEMYPASNRKFTVFRKNYIPVITTAEKIHLTAEDP